MRILIIGGTGTIGSAVKSHFSDNHEVVVASRSRSEIQVDITDSKSIEQMFATLGTFDAIISTSGEAKWAPFNQLTEADFYIGIRSKLMGQVNVVRIGRNYLTPHGSITLTTGILGDDPVVKTASAAMVNGGIHSFVKAAALELTDGIRLNAVSVGMVENSFEKYKSYFPGHPPVSMQKVAFAYERSVLGKDNGKVIRMYQ